MHNTNLNCVKIIITGDLYLGGFIEENCLRNDPANIYNDVLPILLDKDFSITNLECPLTKRKNPIKKSGPNLIADPKCVDIIKYGGFDAVTLANNHIMDHGEEGLFDTQSYCNRENIKTVGIGKNLSEASQPLYIDLKEKKIAFLNFAENEFSIVSDNHAGANPLNPVRNYYQLIEAKRRADFVIVIVHGGNEYYPLPSPQMVETYRYFADLGASAIIGHHTHCVSGYEIYNGVPIFYSIGNFIFDSEKKCHASWFEGFFVRLTFNFDSECKISLFPYYQSKNKPGLELMKGDEKDKFLIKIQEYSHIIEDPYLLEKKCNEFCGSMKADYLSRILLLNRLQRKILKKDILTNIIIKKKKLLQLLNIVRCEAHRNIIIEVLKNEIYKEK